MFSIHGAKIYPPMICFILSNFISFSFSQTNQLAQQCIITRHSSFAQVILVAGWSATMSNSGIEVQFENLQRLPVSLEAIWRYFLNNFAWVQACMILKYSNGGRSRCGEVKQNSSIVRPAVDRRQVAEWTMFDRVLWWTAAKMILKDRLAWRSTANLWANPVSGTLYWHSW